jgi:hypothetical protein
LENTNLKKRQRISKQITKGQGAKVWTEISAASYIPLEAVVKK